MSKKFYITTPIYYANSVPHIGHAYTTIAADIIARYKKSKGVSVHFLTGTDEHGINIEKTARENKCGPKQWCDGIAEQYKEMWRVLGIEYDDFIRTTDARHESVVQEVFERLVKTGDIYKGSYEGWYCEPCENYWEESELGEDKLCPVHKKPLCKNKEETYFFRLSKYEKPLLEFYKNNPDFLAPRARANEIISFVGGGLKDISVSRTKVAWGIPVKSSPSHTIYVWFDALLNYVSAIGLEKHFNGDKTDFENNWPADMHLIGKEIFRFHAVIWPAVLMGLGIELPKQVFAHGWWTVNGEKMSKSRGNFINPADVVKDYGLDALRYFLFREVPFGADGDFSTDNFRQRYNSDLANDLGNLISRLSNMAAKYFDGDLSGADKSKYGLFAQAEKLFSEYEAGMDKIEFDRALEKLWAINSLLNQSIDKMKPWEMAKTDLPALKNFLAECVQCVLITAKGIAPFMPSTAKEIVNSLGGAKIEKMKPLFPRRD